MAERGRQNDRWHNELLDMDMREVLYFLIRAKVLSSVGCVPLITITTTMLRVSRLPVRTGAMIM